MYFLPDGYHPAARSVFTSMRNGALARINVDADGSVMIDFGTSTCSSDGEWVSLEGITFRAV
jgi:hypothetical protein